MATAKKKAPTKTTAKTTAQAKKATHEEPKPVGMPSKEVLEKLYGYSIVSNYAECVIDIDGVPKEFWPIIWLKNISIEDSEKLADEIKSGKNADKESNEFLRNYIVGWDNMFDISTGGKAKFVKDKSGVIAKDLYNQLPYIMRVKILEKLVKLAGLA